MNATNVLYDPRDNQVRDTGNCYCIPKMCCSGVIVKQRSNVLGKRSDHCKILKTYRYQAGCIIERSYRTRIDIGITRSKLILTWQAHRQHRLPNPTINPINPFDNAHGAILLTYRAILRLHSPEFFYGFMVFRLLAGAAHSDITI